MFCPACGFEYTHKTNFCKRCGGELNSTDPPVIAQPPRRLAGVGLFLVAALFGIAGLLLCFTFLWNSLRFDLMPSQEALRVFRYGLTFVGVLDGLLIWQLSRVVGALQRSSPAPAQERVIIREVQPPQLGAPTDPIQNVAEARSVVEHTTRQFANLAEK